MRLGKHRVPRAVASDFGALGDQRRARAWATRAMVSALAVLLGPACATSDTPAESSRSPRDRREDARADRRARESSATAGKKVDAPTSPAVRARDRDPEEERRKMSLSREHSARAKEALRRGADAQAVAEAQRALKVHEQNVEAMLVIAQVFYGQKRYELVQSITSSVLEVDPRVLKPEESSRAHNLKGFAFLAEGNRVAAMRAFRKAAELDERNAAAWNNLGVQYMLQEEFAVAESCFKYAIDLDPSFYKAQLNYGAALRAQGKLPAALAVFQQVLASRPNYAEVHFNLGVLYLDAETLPGMDTTARYNAAISAFVRYRDLAIASGQSARGDDVKANATAARVVTGKELVSPAQADLYIGVARKGLEREARREDRAKRREQVGSESESDAQRPGGTSASGTQTPVDATSPVGESAPAVRPGAGAAPDAPPGSPPSPAPTRSPAAGSDSKPPSSPQRPGAPARPSSRPSSPSNPRSDPSSPVPAPKKPEGGSSPRPTAPQSPSGPSNPPQTGTRQKPPPKPSGSEPSSPAQRPGASQPQAPGTTPQRPGSDAPQRPGATRPQRPSGGGPQSGAFQT